MKIVVPLLEYAISAAIYVFYNIPVDSNVLRTYNLTVQLLQ